MSTGERTLSPRERAILSALIVQAGAGVRADELADAYWGEDVPATWAQQVKTSIARIRTALGTDAVRTVAGGYALGLDLDLVDAARFERFVSAARAHTLHGEPDRALDGYRRALSLWRGDAYPDIAGWSVGAAEAARLAEIRMAAEEEVVDCRLALGDHRAVISDAERLVRAAPLREERWAILALANYRAGRQAEALAALRSARARLDEELGIDVGHRLSELETAMLRQDPSLDAPTRRPAPSVDCPYLGLDAFGIEDSDEFFGRDEEAESVLGRLRPGSLLALAGSSGSGKSSLAMAGVLRRVIDRGREAHVLRPAQLDQLDGVSPTGVALVDQFEELFQLDTSTIDRLSSVLRRHVAAGGTILVTVRSDFLDQCLSHRDLAALFSDRVVPVLPMSREHLREVIERPAERAGLRLESGLTELILRDAADHPAALPLLSHALAETWARREAGVLTVDGYLTAGGLAGAVATSAEQLYQSWDAAEQKACRTLMLRLIERPVDGSIVRRVVPLQGLQADPSRAAIISALVRSRLLSIDQDAVAISHETLVTAWPRLDDWLVDDAEDARMLAAISSATAAWAADGRSGDDLLHGARLQAAVEWRESASPDLMAEERDFLTASEGRAEAAGRDIADRAARDRRQNKRLRWAIAGSGILLVAAIVAASFAAVRGREAEIAAENARFEALVATSLSLLDNDRETASLLAVEAFRRRPDDPRVRSALWGVTMTTGGITDTHHDDTVYRPTMATIPGSSTALRVSSQGGADESSADIVNIATGEVSDTLEVEFPQVVPESGSFVDVSADGSTAAIVTPFTPDPSLADGCCWTHVAFLDLASGEALPGTGTIPVWTSEYPTLDATGRVLYAVHPGTADLIAVDTMTGETRASSEDVFGDHSEDPYSYLGAAIIDDRLVAVGAGDSIRLYDPATLELVRTIPLAQDYSSLDVAADGQGGIVTSGWDGTVRVDITTGEVTWRRFLDPTRSCATLHPATDSTIACGSYEGVALLDLETGETKNGRAILQLNEPPYFDTIDDGSLLVWFVAPTVWMRWQIDGGSGSSGIVAEGRELVSGPEEDESLAVTRPVGGGPMQLWNLATDAPVGAEANLIVPLGSGIVARYTGDEQPGRPRLERLATGEEIRLAGPGIPDSFSVLPGARGGPAFAWWDDGIVAFDPSTGASLGPAMTLPSDHNGVYSATETPDSSVAVITWEHFATGRTETAVFDIRTGELLAGSLYDLQYSHAVDSEELVGIARNFARRYDIRTLEPVAALARAVGGSKLISVSTDGRTLLNVGYNNALTLYDLTTDIALANPLDSDAPGTRVTGGSLSADGETLVEALPDGIRMWDLRVEEQAADACAVAGRELTQEEWSTYFPSEERVATCAALGAAAAG